MTPAGRQQCPPAPPEAGSTCFRPVERIRRRRDYQMIYETGSRLSGRLMTMFLAGNAAGWPRLGIAATRKFGGAVQRNRAKRLIREVFRRNKPGTAVDLVVIPRREMLAAGFEDIQAEFRGLLRRRARQRQ